MNEENKNYSISIYNDALSLDCIKCMLDKLKRAFPNKDAGFFSLLSERIVANKFTDKRLTDAVNNVIDNFKFKDLTIADIISFDKQHKFITYNELVRRVLAGKTSFDNYEIIEVDNQKLWREKR